MTPGTLIEIPKDTTRLSRTQAPYAGQTGTVVAAGLTMVRVKFGDVERNFELAHFKPC